MKKVPTVAERARGALLGTFVGDALGMPFEGASPGTIPVQLEMVDARLGRGTYTDDTEMMIVLAESLIADGSVEPALLARRFLERHDPRRGYGAGTLRVFAHWQDGVSVSDAAALLFGGHGSLGNGAAMRIAPVAVLFSSDPERLVEEARRSAKVTHVHPLGVDGAVAQAVAVGAAMRTEEIVATARAAVETDEMRRRLDTVAELLTAPPANPTTVAEKLGNTSAAALSVPAAIYAACHVDDFRGAVSYAVRCGGDTDTIGAMTGAIAGARHGHSEIPSNWVAFLEDGRYGRSHVQRLADRLAAAASS
ncbi:MAG TPA: ADP-ribosylglycohydrolase family protein [Mycobacterium sp.]|nr:ADP-ribosylglycohydrolase family protein [Mycobacterium sp.]